jgi:AcrR family transcriptional regulator
MNVKGPKQQRAEETRARLLATARDLFAERGYADTATEELVERAAVTRGALYYHFRDKRDLFRAVFEQVEGEATAALLAAAAGAPSPRAAVRLAVDAFLDACLDPAMRRIVLLDAPAVLGWESWREVMGRYGLGLVEQMLTAMIEAGEIERQPVEPLAHLLLGALSEAALYVAESPDPPAARAAIGDAFERLFAGLRGS